MLNKKIKKSLSLLLAMVLCLSVFWVAPFAFGVDGVEINESTFPDPVFRRIVADVYDRNEDGYLSVAERSATYMNLSGRIDIDENGDPVETIDNLKGVEYFTSLTMLRCGGLGLNTLDVSGLMNLTLLTCQGNNLATLDLSYNTALLTVNCSDNVLTNIILPMSTEFESLNCYANSLEKLNLSGVPGLRSLYCHQNELDRLDLSSNTSLNEINCQQNHLTSLDLSRTALDGVTQYEIGNQSVTVKAVPNGNKIVVPFSGKGLNSNTNYRGCSLDAFEDGSGFQGDQFVAYDVDRIKDGITYECYPMLENSQNMDVTINVTRDFYQVAFFADEAMENKLGIHMVPAGEAAQPVQITETPQCKTFESWSGDITSVNEDMDVYVIWKDSHGYVPYAIDADKDTVTVRCGSCGHSYNVSFSSIVNSKTGDENFDECIDVVNDGNINAKDFAQLLKDLG